jgi:hypothetical protein
VPPLFRSVDDVVAGLAALEGQLQAKRDLRGLFVMAYVAITQTIGQWIDRGVFLDNAAMARHVVAFANAYRRALADCVAGERSRVPLAWQQSFDACDERNRSVFQCLMLGINAHMKRDLPYAVIEAGVDVNCNNCYQDYVRIDDALRQNIPLVRRRIAEVYGAELPDSARWLGRLVDFRIACDFRRARRNSWTFAQLLARADTESARAQVDRVIEERAASAGRKILEFGNAAIERRMAPAVAT